MALLELDDVSVHYGRIQAIHNMSIHVDEGEIVSLIGANGAGKTTTMRSIAGLLSLSGGSITFDGEDISKTKAHMRVVKGMSLTPEGRGIFPSLTVMENLDMGAYTRSDKEAMAEDLDRVFDLFPRLKERQKQSGGTMSGGEQQMLAIGRALMARPKLLLLDEPSMGLAPQFIRHIFSIVKQVNQQGTTVLLVEQNANQALKLAHRAYILETGRITREGLGRELASDDAVRAAYLGA
ncbi:ABC transporter ATP-binding protein [Branchiibius sp. NY16-3462-2]|uniref:ABC transporter ATP-binding protein n=1 Tax=Branchiibius sp. NY16-3462-2 TaxID=1807500 RepID=UPI0007953544|nr:ABC transporter ATP-binding protein [Branchiibius sp. NY16-3462-2]KYH44341.1 ABC transporter ATP-binding protein [Branchiibius sp. NY16-3462-2]